MKVTHTTRLAPAVLALVFGALLAPRGAYAQAGSTNPTTGGRTGEGARGLDTEDEAARAEEEMHQRHRQGTETATRASELPGRSGMSGSSMGGCGMGGCGMHGTSGGGASGGEETATGGTATGGSTGEAETGDADRYGAERDRRERTGKAAERRGILGRYQLGVSAGGGISEFANTNVRDITDVGGAWTARIIVGTRSPVALEAAYIGTANQISTLGLDTSTLVANGAEGALRLQVVNVPLNRSESILLKPYLLAGFAWKHYELSGADFNTSSVQDNDEVFEIPLGVGLAWNFGRFLADQRFDYRPAFSNDLVGTLGQGNEDDDNSLQTWSLSARVGVEF